MSDSADFVKIAKFLTNDYKRICREHGAPYPHAVPAGIIGALMASEREGVRDRRGTRTFVKEFLEESGFSYIPKKQ